MGITMTQKVKDIVFTYCKLADEKETAKACKTSVVRVNKVVDQHIKTLSNLRETNMLIRSTTQPISRVNKMMKKAAQTKTINEPFLELLSPPNSTELSDAESLFCYVLTISGDQELAITEAGLEVGILTTTRQESQVSKKICIRLRAQYLRAKPNVAMELNELKRNKWEGQDVKVSKETIQLELLEQLEEMKQSPEKNRKEIQNNLKLLGQTEGAYIETIQTSEIDPSQAMDDLIEAADSTESEEV